MKRTKSTTTKGGNLLIPALIFLFVILLFRIILFLGVVPTSSMEPTLEEGQIILGLRTGYSLEDGDIIVFRHNGILLVKRVSFSGGEPVPVSVDPRQLTVPEDCYYVLGDNPGNSDDSRSWQSPFVPASDIVAEVILPPSH